MENTEVIERYLVLEKLAERTIPADLRFKLWSKDYQGILQERIRTLAAISSSLSELKTEPTELKGDRCN